MFRRIRKIYILCFIISAPAFMVGCSKPQQQDVLPKPSANEPMVQESNEPAAEAPKAAQPQPQAPPVQESVDKPVQEQTVSSQENPQAQQQMEFAIRYMDSAEKGILSYSQAVALCRQMIKNYSGTPYETQARELLRQVPEDQRPRYHITDEELGL